MTFEEWVEAQGFVLADLEEKQVASLKAMFEGAGLSVEATRQLSKEFEFHAWADRQHASDAAKEKLLEMMRNIPEALEPLFAPRWTDSTMYFSLWEVVIVARRSEA